MKSYSTIPVKAAVFHWLGTANHTHDAVLAISSTASEFGIAVRTEHERLVLIGDNGRHSAGPDYYVVIRADGMYETMDYDSLHEKYTSLEPFSAPAIESEEQDEAPIAM